MNDTRQMVPAYGLKLGDRIRITTGAWRDCIVSKIDEDAKEIHLFRPYGVSADFTYTGGVICYIGIENFTIPRNATLIEFIEAAPSAIR